MGLTNAWHSLRIIWNFILGAFIGGITVAAYFLWIAAPPATPAQVKTAHGEPVAGWHFVPNGTQGCTDKYGCARPTFDPDFWKWVASGEEGCTDEHGCARPRSPAGAALLQQAGETPEGAGTKGGEPKAGPEGGAGPQTGSAGQESPSSPK